MPECEFTRAILINDECGHSMSSLQKRKDALFITEFQCRLQKICKCCSTIGSVLILCEIGGCFNSFI